MVGGKREKRAEQKFGVKTQFPNLSLHSAAASGNVGLVKFALTNGQPATSILNGVQPIHAACSGGNEACVRLLLEYGADVNAPRLPRRYNADKKAGVSVGTSGSTPLHFAAANGHLRLVQLLLSCGARPDLTEKRGLTPEDLARENGHPDVCDALQKWDRQVAAAAADHQHHAKNTHHGRASKLPPPDLPSGGAISPVPSIGSSMGTTAAGSYAARMLSSGSSVVAPFDTAASTTTTSGSQPVSGTTTPDSTAAFTSPATTFNSLTYEPNNRSTTSLGSHQSASGRRRPSLPSVMEKAAHPGAALKQALGSFSGHHHNHNSSLAKPPPLKLAMSTSDAFDVNQQRAEPAKVSRRPSLSLSAKSSITSVFGKRSSSTSLASPTVGSPDEADEDRLLLRQGHSEQQQQQQQQHPVVHRKHSHPAHGSVQSATAAPAVSTAQRAQLNSPDQPASAPPPQTSFFPPPTTTPASTQQHQQQQYQQQQPPPQTATGAVQQPPPTMHAAAYRPRTSSLMSNTGSIEQALEHGTVPEIPLAAPSVPWHTRSPSSGSGSATSSIFSFGPATAQASASRAAMDLTSPSLASEDGDFSSTQGSPPRHSQHSDHHHHQAQNSEEAAVAAASSTATEERDSFASLQPNSTFRPRVSPRLRADSVGSNSSTASHLSPYAVHTHSPLGSYPAPNPPPDSIVEPRPSLYARPRRSGSGSTEADLRQLVLSANNITGLSPTSPTSLSSWSGSNYLGSSAASTRATSDGHPVPSVRDPPASPRKVHRSDITPQQAHSLVKEAERSLRLYNAHAGASQPSLSEQLASYGDKVSLEREINRRERNKLDVPPDMHQRKFVWERLDQDGHHSLLTPSEGEGRTVSSSGSKPTSIRRLDPYQQGNLDVRRPEAPSLRRPSPHGAPHSPASTSRLEIPPAVDPRLALRSNVHKIYDSRAASLSGQRPPKTPFQYTILESNQPPSSAPPTGRSSPNTVDDPVLRLAASSSHGPLSSAASSTSSAPSSIALGTRPSRSRLGPARGNASTATKSRQSSGGAMSSQSSPTHATATSDESRPGAMLQLETPTAPRKVYEPVSGFEGLNMSGQPKNFLTKGFNRLRQGLQ